MPPALPTLAHVDAVVLDLDGTLVDTLGDFTAALHAMLGDLGLARLQPTLPAQVIASMVGKGSEHLIRSALTHAIGTEVLPGPTAQRQAEALYPQAWASYQAHYARINGRHASVYPGVVPGLAQLAARGLPLACLTNKPTAFARELLARKGLQAAFAHIFGGDAFERKKPDPLPLLRTCEALGTQPQRTLMVGDSVNDALAARAAGCPVVLVSYGYNHGRPVRSVQADGHIDSLAELS